MYKAGKKVLVKPGIYSCLEDSFMELNIETQVELKIIADISEEKKVIVDASNKQPVRVAIPYYQIAT